MHSTTKATFDQYMSEALRDPQLWQSLISTAAGRRKAAEWLRGRRASVEEQLFRRQEEFDIWKAGDYRPDFDEKAAEYHSWRMRAQGFRTVVCRHLAELEQAATSGESDEALWLRLAEAISAHEEAIHPDDATDDDRRLWRMLDVTTLPGGTALREALNTDQAA